MTAITQPRNHRGRPQARRWSISAREPQWPLLLAAYLLFSVYATWPALPDIGRGVMLGQDASASIWNLWWVKESLFHLHNPFFTHQILAPEGTYLSYDALEPLAGILLLPATATIGAAKTLAVTRVLLPAVSALFAQRAGRRVGLDYWPAVLCGGLYGFATLIAWKITFQFNFGFGAPFLPLTLLLAARCHQIGKRRDAAALGAVLGAQHSCRRVCRLSRGIIAVTYTLWAGGLPRSIRTWRLVGITTVVCLAIAAPQLWEMHKASAAGFYSADPAVDAASYVGYAASVVGLLSPGNVKPFFPGHLGSGIDDLMIPTGPAMDTAGASSALRFWESY